MDAYLKSKFNCKNENFISLQIGVEIENKPFVLLIIDKDYYSTINPQFKPGELLNFDQNNENVLIQIQPTSEKSNFDIFMEWISHLTDLRQNKKFNLHFYEDFKDLIAFFGWECLEEIINHSQKKRYQSFLEDKNCWKGMVEKVYFDGQQNLSFKFILKDKYGWSKEGLLPLLSTLGIQYDTNYPLKNYEDDYSRFFEDKELMIQLFKKEINSLIGLSKTSPKMALLLNTITTKVLKLKMEEYTPSNIPDTMGVIASQILNKYLENQFQCGERYLKIIKNYGFDEEFSPLHKKSIKRLK